VVGRLHFSRFSPFDICILCHLDAHCSKLYTQRIHTLVAPTFLPPLTSTMSPLPASLTALLLALLTLSTATASPQPPLVSAHDTFLIPRHTLFLRQTTDLQTFTGALAGVAASPITSSGDAKRPFSVDGDTFTDFQSAAERSCDNQKNGCVYPFTLSSDYL
jgi:hypothetical protein